MKYGIIIVMSLFLSACFSTSPAEHSQQLRQEHSSQDIYGNTQSETKVFNQFADVISYSYSSSSAPEDNKERSYTYTYVYYPDGKLKLKSYQYKSQNQGEGEAEDKSNIEESYKVDISYTYQKNNLLTKVWKKEGETYRSQVNQYENDQLISTELYEDKQQTPYEVLSAFNQEGKNPEKEIKYRDGKIKYTVVNKYNNLGLQTSSTGGFQDSVTRYKNGKKSRLEFVGHATAEFQYGENGVDFQQRWTFSGRNKVERVSEVRYRGNVAIMSLPQFKTNDVY